MAEHYLADQDAQPMLDVIGEPVTSGGVTVNGSVSFADETMLVGGLGHLIGKAISVALKLGALPGLAVGSSITIRGTVYKVRGIEQIAGGSLVRALASVE